MKIALVAGEDPGWGGIGTYTGVLGRALIELGHDVQLILRGWDEDRTETLDGLTVHRVTVPEPSWRRGTVRAMERLYTTRDSLAFARRVGAMARGLGADVVEGPEFGAPMVATALGRRRSHTIVRLHSPSFLTAQLAQDPVRLDLRLQELLEATSAHAARIVTSPSHALADLVRRRWRLRSSAIRVVPNPVDAHLFAPSGGPAHVPGRILIVGRVERAKGHDVLVEAMPAVRAAIREAHVLAVGADGGLLEALAARAAALGITSALSFAGARERRELPDLYRSAAVCVTPSRFEALPYSALEAMACGRAVVGSRVGGLAELVEDGRSGVLVDPGDPMRLAGALTGLLRDENRRRALEEGARERVLSAYSAGRVAAAMAEVYAEAAQ